MLVMRKRRRGSYKKIHREHAGKVDEGGIPKLGGKRSGDENLEEERGMDKKRKEKGAGDMGWFPKCWQID